MVEPGQDLLLAALSESGISPNDLFDIDGGDAGLATPTPTPPIQQVRVFQSICKKWIKKKKMNFFLVLFSVIEIGINKLTLNMHVNIIFMLTVSVHSQGGK